MVDGIASLRVLVIEDNQHMRAIMSTILAGIGIREIIEANDGLQALRHLKEHPEDETVSEFLEDVPRLRFLYSGYDDAEEDVDDGSVSLRSNLDLIHDADPGDDEDQVVGIRFQDIPVPQGARIKRVYVQFTAYSEDPGSEKTVNCT